MHLVSFAVPAEYGVGVAAKGINTMLKAIDKATQTGSKIPTMVYRAFKATRAHNYYDCEGMRQVTLRATREME